MRSTRKSERISTTLTSLRRRLRKREVKQMKRSLISYLMAVVSRKTARRDRSRE